MCGDSYTNNYDNVINVTPTFTGTGSVTITGKTLDGAQSASAQIDVDDSGDLDLTID